MVICGVLGVCVLLLVGLHLLGNRAWKITEDNGVKLKYYASASNPHDGFEILFYKNKLICPRLGGDDPKRFLIK